MGGTKAPTETRAMSVAIASRATLRSRARKPAMYARCSTIAATSPAANMSRGSIRKTSLARPSARATMKKARSAELTGFRARATAINPTITAGLAAYSIRRAAFNTAAQSTAAITPVAASRTSARPVMRVTLAASCGAGRLRVGEVALEGRPDPRREPGGRGRGERLDLHHVTEHREPDELARGKARAHLGVIQLEGLGDPGEDLAADEVAHQLSGAFARDHRPHDRMGADPCRRVPDLDEEPGQPDAEPVQPRSQELGDRLRGVEWKVHGGLENA